MKKTNQGKVNINNSELLNKIIQSQKLIQDKRLNKTRLSNINDTQESNNNQNINNDLVDLEINNNDEKVIEDKKKPKKQIKRLKLDEKHILFNENGIKKLYDRTNEFEAKINKFSIFENENNKCENDLNSFIHLLKSWHFDLFPKFEFKYFLSKLTDLGNKPATKAYMNRLRRIYKGEQTWDCILNHQENILNPTTMNDYIENDYKPNKMQIDIEDSIEEEVKPESKRNNLEVNDQDYEIFDDFDETHSNFNIDNEKKQIELEYLSDTDTKKLLP
jgi:hypothetical protein